MSSVFNLLSTYSSAYRSSLRSSIDLGLSTAMDSVLAISLGLGLRVLLDILSLHDLRIEGSLVGLWEGLVLFHFLKKWPQSYDPYVGYGFRLFVDFLVTENLAKLIVVMLWTGVGVVMSDVGPAIWESTSMRRVYRRISRDVILDVAGLRSLAKPSGTRVRFSSPLRDAPPGMTPASPTAGFSFTASARSRPLPGSFPGVADTETERSTRSETSSCVDVDERTDFVSRTTGLPTTTGSESLTSAEPSSTTEDMEDDGSTPTNQPADLPTTHEIPDEYDFEDPSALELARRPSLGSMQDISEPPQPPSPRSDAQPPAEDGLASPLMIPPRLDAVAQEEQTEQGADQEYDPTPKEHRRRSLAETEFTRESIISFTDDVDKVLRRASELRTAAEDADVARDQLKQDLETARREKRWGDAFMLMLAHRTQTDKAASLHGRAARRFHHANNVTAPPETLVVRNLRLDEAMRLIERKLGEMWSGEDKPLGVLRIDAGTGDVRSGSWPLKQAIVHEMSDILKIPTDMDPNDSGVLIVSPPPAS